MNSTIWLNAVLAVPFLLAIIGIPLWLTWRHTDGRPDFSRAHAYLAGKPGRAGVPARLSSASGRAG